jgi:hypothetical protein
LKKQSTRAKFTRHDEFLYGKQHSGRTNMKPITLGMILCSTLLGLAQVAQAHQCTISDAAGRYGYTSSGSIVTPPVGPFTAVGHVTFTDSGTLSGAQTTSIAGNLVDETIEGTFTVNSDCTGSMTAYVFRGTTLVRTSQLSVVWDIHQNEARAIFLTPGTNISILARRMNEED